MICDKGAGYGAARATSNRGYTVLPLVCFVLALSLGTVYQVDAEKSQKYSMSTICRNLFLRDMYRKIDGAVLISQNEKNIDCAITFQTHSILQRFMLKFDRLQLDCNDHLYIYDGAHSVGSFKADLSCRNTMQSVGAIYTHTNYVTLKYITDNWGTESNGFRLVITAIKDSKHSCKDFRCSSSEFCIGNDLVCDGINHCEDGSDEATSGICVNTETSSILGMESTWFAVIMVGLVLAMAGFVTAGVLCFCRQRVSTPRHPYNAHNAQGGPVSYPLQPMFGSNGASAGGMPMGMTNIKLGPLMGGVQGATTLPRPGNWLHPAGLRHGHSAARVRLYCQEK